ncbi:hypothetical protein BV898_08622 [Hypsibius exemplaris]|uniref:Uncharacterized protein n=1 Tax=Hypsibius exemplaris TaxID=2072580 RepID=A0A1W0WPV1_HYPEX|nr:hypothetical protein BV898_08622 [Hypsibius exemplaris]
MAVGFAEGHRKHCIGLKLLGEVLRPDPETPTDEGTGPSVKGKKRPKVYVMQFYHLKHLEKCAKKRPTDTKTNG